MNERSLPKHVTHRAHLSNGMVDIHHLIAKNNFVLDVINKDLERFTINSLNRDDLRSIRDSINKILRES